MRPNMFWCAVGLLIVVGACAQTQASPLAAKPDSLLSIDGNRIWAKTEGSGVVTVVFESGLGNDSTVWSHVVQKIQSVKVRTLVYDRAGMGKSTINTAIPYSIENDTHVLKSVIAMSGIDGPIIMVGHSYGGGIALVAASQDSRIKGLVLLDSVVPRVWSDDELEKNLTSMRSQYSEIREKAPDLAKVVIPWAEALPETRKTIDGARIPGTLPIIDIVAEKGQDSPESTRVWRSAHVEFTANNPHREYILAEGSSHKVMIDKVDLVVDSITKMLDMITK